MRVKGKVGTVEIEGTVVSYIPNGDDRRQFFARCEFIDDRLDLADALVCVDRDTTQLAEADLRFDWWNSLSDLQRMEIIKSA